MNIRHDAAACRAKAQSELLRRSLGIETSEERGRRLAREAETKKAIAKQAALGTALFEIENLENES